MRRSTMFQISSFNTSTIRNQHTRADYEKRELKAGNCGAIFPILIKNSKSLGISMKIQEYYVDLPQSFCR